MWNAVRLEALVQTRCLVEDNWKLVLRTEVSCLLDRLALAANHQDFFRSSVEQKELKRFLVESRFKREVCDSTHHSELLGLLLVLKSPAVFSLQFFKSIVDLNPCLLCLRNQAFWFKRLENVCICNLIIHVHFLIKETGRQLVYSVVGDFWFIFWLLKQSIWWFFKLEFQHFCFLRNSWCNWSRGRFLRLQRLHWLSRLVCWSSPVALLISLVWIYINPLIYRVNKLLLASQEAVRDAFNSDCCFFCKDDHVIRLANKVSQNFSSKSNI